MIANPPQSPQSPTILAEFKIRLPLPEIRIGGPIDYLGSLSESIAEAPCKVSQIMLCQGFRKFKIAPSDLVKAIKVVQREDSPSYPSYLCFSHLSFMYNLAGTVKSLAWNGDSRQDKKTENMIKAISEELEIFSKLSSGCVIHIGAYPDKKAGISAVIKTINKIPFRDQQLLILENAAGEGNKLGSTLKELSTIYKGVKKKDHIGFCLDTCHLFAQGDYDLSLCSEIDRLYDDFDSEIGIEKLSLIHLNDSSGKKGCHLDRHEILGDGKIWKDNIPVLLYFLNRFCTVPMICETDYDSVEVVRKFMS